MVIQSHQILDLLLHSYNSQDVNEVLSYFNHEAAIYQHPSKLFLKGTNDIYDYMTTTFTKYPINQAEILYRMVNGNHVIDMTRLLPHPEEPPLDFVIIYELKNDLIVRVDVVK